MRPTAAWSAMLPDVTWPSDRIEWSTPSLSRSKLVTAGLLQTLQFSFSHTRTTQRRRRRPSARVNGHGGSDRALACTGTVAAAVVARTRPCPCAHGRAGADNTPEKTSAAMLRHPRHLGCYMYNTASNGRSLKVGRSLKIYNDASINVRYKGR